MTEEVTELADDPAGVPDDAILLRRVDWDKIGGRDSCPPGKQAALNGNCFSDYSAAKAREYGFAGPCMSVGSAQS